MVYASNMINFHRHVEGGMGSVSVAISKAAREAGVHIATNAEVHTTTVFDIYYFHEKYSLFHNIIAKVPVLHLFPISISASKFS